eukprot:gb/GECG01009180.1/.p1 GENE.gb/GECG01009180.1/~~gb/GECG01009180.1/.p1  ORF type:complete len:443 (+),score=47.14 gb/GECG01009180.1/:1-1329(+)
MDGSTWRSSLARFLGKSPEDNNGHFGSSSSSRSGRKRSREAENGFDTQSSAAAPGDGEEEGENDSYNNTTTACEGCITLWTCPDDSVRWGSVFAYCWQVAAAGGICVILVPDRRMGTTYEGSEDIQYLRDASHTQTTPLEIPIPYLNKKSSTEIEVNEYLQCPRILERIQLRYVSSLQEVVDYASHMHRYPDDFNYPDVVLFHDVHLLLSRNNNRNLEIDDLEYKRQWCFFMGILRHILRIPSLKQGNSSSVAYNNQRSRPRTKQQHPLLGKGMNILVSLNADIAEKENRSATYRCLSHCVRSTMYPMEVIGEYIDQIVALTEHFELGSAVPPHILNNNGDLEVCRAMECFAAVKHSVEGLWTELPPAEGVLNSICVCLSKETQALYIPCAAEGHSIFKAAIDFPAAGYTRPEGTSRSRTREDWQVESISRIILPRNHKAKP